MEHAYIKLWSIFMKLGSIIVIYQILDGANVII